MSQPLLLVEDLKTYFYLPEGVLRAVDGLNLIVNRNEIVGIIGESGSGKTVTALSILRIVPPPGRIVDGKIVFDGENLLEKSEEEMMKIRGGKISMIFQDPISSLDPLYRVKDQLSEVIRMHRGLTDESEIKEEIIRLLSMVKIPDPDRLMNAYPHELSGGMAQRVMIAIALASNPLLLIADEPTSNLDVTIQAQILELLRELHERRGLSILMISHNFGVIAELCDKVVVMYCGEAIESGSLIDVFENPAHPYTKGLLSVVPKLHGVSKHFETIPGSLPNPLNPPSGCKFHPRCPKAMNICRKVKPPRCKLNRDHVVSCHLYT